MRVGEFSTGMGKLREAKVLLERSWYATQEQWADDTARKFEDMHLKPLLENSAAAIAATAQLSGILRQARHECSEESTE